MEFNNSKTIANSSVHTGVNLLVRFISCIHFLKIEIRSYCVYCFINFILNINML